MPTRDEGGLLAASDEPSKWTSSPGRSTALVSRRQSQDIVPSDPLQRYMQEVRHYDLLDREEEHETAVRYVETSDPKSAFRLVTANLRLVVKIAMEYKHTRIPVVDLVQEGNVGLMLAVKKYDPFKGVRFGSYAQWWIRAYILKYLMDNHSIIKVGTTQAQRKLFYNLKKERAKLEARGIKPTAEDLADRLDVRTRDVVEMQKRLSGGAEVSLDTPLRERESGVLGDVIPSKEVSVEDQTADAQLQGVLEHHFAKFRKDLTDRENVFWDRRLLSDEPWTLQRLGDEFSVSRERARQIEARILKKLKDYLKKELPELEGINLAVGGE